MSSNATRVHEVVLCRAAARASVGLAFTVILGCSAEPATGGLATGGTPTGNGGSASGSGGSAGSTSPGGVAGSSSSAGAKATGGAASGGAPATGGAGGVGGVGGGIGGSGGASSGGAMAGATGSPLCSLDLHCTSAIVDDPKVNCTLQISDGTGMYWYMGAAGVEWRGRSSIAYPKKNYSVELRLANGDENPVPMLGMGKESDWIFDGSWVDRSFMRNDLVFSLFRDMGRYAPESRYCTLRLNDQNQGIYRLVEKIKRDDDRVAIGEDDGSGNTFIIGQDDEGTLTFPVGSIPESSRWALVYPKQEVSTAAQRAAVQTFLDQLNSALRGADPGNSTGGPFAYLDFEAAVDFVLLEEFSKNVDAYNLSLNLFRNAGGKAGFIPWDFDLAFGQPTIRNATNENAEGWVYNRTPLINELSNMQAFRARLGTRWRELRAQSFATPAVLARLAQFQAVLLPSAVADNFAVWPLAQVDFSRIYRPYTLYPVSSYAQEVTALQTFVQARLTWMDAHIDAYPN